MIKSENIFYIQIILFLFLFYNVSSESIYVVSKVCIDNNIDIDTVYRDYTKYEVYDPNNGCKDFTKIYAECKDEEVMIYDAGNQGECIEIDRREKVDGCCNENEFNYCTNNIEINDGECHGDYYIDEDCKNPIKENVFTIGERTKISDREGILFLYGGHILFHDLLNYKKFYQKYPGEDKCFQLDGGSQFGQYLKLRCKNNIKVYEYKITRYFHDDEYKNTSSLFASRIDSCEISNEFSLNDFNCIKLEHRGTYLRIVKTYEDPDKKYCNGEPDYIDFEEQDLDMGKPINRYIEYCSNSIPIIPGGVFSLLYNKEDKCGNIIDFDFAYLHHRENICKIPLHLAFIESEYINRTHFKYKILESVKSTCEFGEEKEEEFFSCLHVDNANYQFYARTTYLINEVPNLLNETICDHESCVLSGEFTLPSMHVNIKLDISNSKIIIDTDSKIDDDEDEPIIFVDKEGEVNVEGLEIIFDIETVDDYNKIKEKVKNDGEYNINILEGKYYGKIGNGELRVPDSIEDCEKLSSRLIEEEDKIMLGLNIDSSGCGGVKWWVPLIIVEGIVFVIIVVFIILVFKVEKIRSYFLPYYP